MLELSNMLSNILLQAFTIDVNVNQLLGYASDVANDLVPMAMTVGGVMLGIRIYRAIRR